MMYLVFRDDTVGFLVRGMGLVMDKFKFVSPEEHLHSGGECVDEVNDICPEWTVCHHLTTCNIYIVIYRYINRYIYIK